MQWGLSSWNAAASMEGSLAKPQEWKTLLGEKGSWPSPRLILQLNAASGGTQVSPEPLRLRYFSELWKITHHCFLVVVGRVAIGNWCSVSYYNSFNEDFGSSYCMQATKTGGRAIIPRTLWSIYIRITQIICLKSIFMDQPHWIRTFGGRNE